jgi:hypothetical protein
VPHLFGDLPIPVPPHFQVAPLPVHVGISVLLLYNRKYI